ncbi:MAG: hypothetical protein AAGA66_13650, partial [Bacteroidota bacterium]
MSIFIAFTILFGWNLQYLDVDFEFEKFFPKNDPDSRDYEIHRKQFGYDNDFLLIVLESENGIFNASFLKKTHQFETSLSQISGIEQVVSPISQKHLIHGPTGLLAFPLVHVEEPDKLAQDSIRIFSSPFYASSFSIDRKAYTIYLVHEHFSDQKQSEKLVEEIQSLAKTASLDSIKIVGKLTAQNVFIEFIQNDFGRYLLGSLIL